MNELTPYEVLEQSIGPEQARQAIAALQTHADKRRAGRSAPRWMVVFHPAHEQQEPEWGCAIDPDTPCRYNDIHGQPPAPKPPNYGTIS